MFFCEKKVVYLSLKEERAYLQTEMNVNVKCIDIVDLFKKKYKIAEIEKNQIKIFLELDNIIKTVKEILIFLSQDQLSLNIDDNVFSKIFADKIIIETEDFDTYCTDIANKLNSLNITNAEKLEKSNILETHKILFNYLEETNDIFVRNIKLGFIHIYEAMNHFLFFFDLLLKIRNLFKTFFFFIK